MANEAPPPLRVAFHTQGCRLNQYDTEVIKEAMRRWRPVDEVPWDGEADIYLLNSCTVTGKAAQACRRLARQVKHRHPQARVVVAGCYAQVQPAELAAVPEIDAIVGNTVKEQIDHWLPAVLAGDPVRVHVEPFGSPRPLDNPAIAGFGSRTRAHVKVQDGCNLRCSYCQIWRARGPSRSRPAAAVLAEVRQLHRQAGYREVILTGVHLGDWGRDLGGEPADLCDLLAAICRELPHLRVRLSSLHPDDVGPRLLELMAATPQLQPHLHLSLQSGSDAVLRRMRRPYRSETAAQAVRALTRRDPAYGVGADLIAGFPGESDAEFLETVAFVSALPFSYLHVFRYSPRPGTPAAGLSPVPPEIVTARAETLRKVGRCKREAFGRGLIGKSRTGVIERPDPATPLRKVTLDNYAAVSLQSDLPAGTLVAVEPTAWRGGELHGRILRVVAAAMGPVEVDPVETGPVEVNPWATR
jgi:threonylcarbamoyladenosine tRNA methylthiotransferase MtaB